MRILTLPLPLYTNYGGILQAYALQTALQRMGHEVTVLQKIPTQDHNFFLLPLVWIKRLIFNIFLGKSVPVFAEKIINRARGVVGQHTFNFINKHIHILPIKEFNEIRLDEYDSIIVGSDQIWRHRYFTESWKSNIRHAFLDFAASNNIRKIAYAASFGLDNLDEYPQQDLLRCKQNIKKFHAVSVREDSGVSICMNKLGVNAEHVLDPTLLLSKDDYSNLIKSEQEEVKGKLFSYILDKNPYKSKIEDIIKETLGIQIFRLDSGDFDILKPADEQIQPPVETWLSAIRDAKFVITDSFHACVFSIIFEKPFAVVDNSSRGLTRITSLLKQFGLEKRLLSENASSDEIVDLISKPIKVQNYSSLKQKSLNFLQSSLD